MEKDAEILLNIETNEKLEEISKNTEASLLSQDETKEAIKELQPSLDANLIQSIENTEKIVEAVEKSSSVSIEIKGADIIKYKGEKGDKGDKGDSPTKEEITGLIEPLIPTEEDLVKIIEPLIPEPIKGEDGQDYILTEKDKKEIAQSIKVPIVEKVIEKTEVIRETPITIDKTKTVVKEVAKYETAKEIAKKLNTLTKEIDFKVIKNFPDFSKNGGSGLNTVFTDGTTILGNGLADNPLRAVGGGGGAVDSVNGQTGVVVLDADDIDDTSTTNKFVTSADLTKLSNLSGTNTGDQTSIVGITGTKAEFDTAVTDGNFLYVGDITQYTDEMAQDAVGGILTNSTFINLTYSDATPSITASLNATGTPSSSTYLRGDNTWATIGGGGDVTKVGTPVNNQIGVWTGDGTIEGTSGLTYDGSNLLLTGDLGSTGSRITKGWFTDLQVTNAIAGSITGNAGTVTNATLTTALTVNTGTVTLVGNVANTSVLTIGAGAVSVSGANTGDQTITNSSDATSHTVTLSASGGSVQLIEGSNITLTTGGTGSAGTVTISASGGGLAWGNSISGTTADGVTLTMSNSANDGASALKLIADNTQTNQSALANLQLGTSGNVQGLLIQGTGSTTVGAVGTGKNHLSLWANVDTSNVNVLSIANGTAYTQTLRILANGAIIDDAGTNTLPSNYALNYDVGDIGASNRAILRAIFGNTQTNAGLSGVKFSVGTSGKVSGGYAQGTFSTDYDFTTGGVGWAAHGNTASQNTAAFLAGNETSFTRRWSVSTAGQTVQDLAITTVSANFVTLPNSVTSAKAGYEVTLGNTQANSPYGFLANVGTSAKVTGAMIKGTFGTATTGLTSAFTAWGNTAAQATRAIAIGNGTSFTETAFINTDGNATLATLTTTGNIELGHASDTTISRVSAGLIAVEGNNVARSTDVQIFTSTGANTWTKPANAKWVEVTLIGGGGGGGSGRKGASLSERLGGGGGGGGGYSSKIFPSASLGSSETVTVGAGGAGGASQSTNSTDGNIGTAGGNTSFGSWLVATGGGAGNAGTDSAVSSSAGGAGTFYPQFSGGGAYVDAGGDIGLGAPLPNSIADNNDFEFIAGGGGGGGMDVLNTVFAGTDGGWGSQIKDGTGYAGGTGGSDAVGGSGTAVTASTLYGGGGGGGGGGRHAGGNAYAGGDGGIYGAGGGGGGASTDSVGNSGAGGNGANGIAIITTYF